MGMQYSPDGYKESLSLERAIMLAYGPQSYYAWGSSKILNAPAWVANDIYDLDARVAPEDLAVWQQALADKNSQPLLRTAWQAALKDCCKLALRVTPIDVPYLNLVVDKHGAKLKDTVPGAIKPVSGKSYALGKGFYIEDNGQRQYVGVTMEELATSLMLASDGSNPPIQDRTGLTGRYDFTVPWYGYKDCPASEIGNPLDRLPIRSIGLVLRPGKGPGYILNIDHIERPDAN